jgi:hypothetical protein
MSLVAVMKAIQVQEDSNSINAKLDKIKELMEEVLIELKNEDTRPTESQVKIDTLKRLNKMAKDIASGKRKTIKFKNIQDLDRIVTGYKA